ncbi:hypothetical protein C8R46DRAFT_384572 [Mycena filopes]|nr:hypothetical protein C8R46DRAFT_384572 [Mycena filopes]
MVISPTVSSPTLSEVGWHPSSIMSPIIEYAFGHEPTVPAHPLFQSGWIPAACLANHYVPITSDDCPPQMCEVFVSTYDLHVHHAPFHNLPLLPQPDHSVWDAQRCSPPPDEFFSTDFFSVSENYISMLAHDPVMAGEPAAQNLFASLEPSHLSAEPRRGSVSSPDPYLTSPMDTPYDDFASTPDESPLSDFSLSTPVHNDDDVLVSTLVADGRYDSQLPLFGGVFESTQPTTPLRKPTNALSSRFREPSYDFSGSSSPLLPSVVVTPPSSSRALPPASPRPDPGLPVSEAFDARPDVFDDSRAASHLVPSILLSSSPPAPNLPRSRRGRDATGVKHPIGDTLDPFISTNFKRRRTGS